MIWEASNTQDQRQVENNNLGDTVRFHVLCKYYPLVN